jgi:hypothetical protein
MVQIFFIFYLSYLVKMKICKMIPLIEVSKISNLEFQIIDPFIKFSKGIGGPTVHQN